MTARHRAPSRANPWTYHYGVAAIVAAVLGWRVVRRWVK